MSVLWVVLATFAGGFLGWELHVMASRRDQEEWSRLLSGHRHLVNLRESQLAEARCELTRLRLALSGRMTKEAPYGD